MAGRVEGGRPGIRGLLRLLDDREYEEALQADLLDRGKSLDDLGRSLSWWDLRCIIRWLPPHAAVVRLRDPDSWQWGLAEHILAGIYDGIQGGNWQRGGNRSAPRPKPLPRPGVGRKKPRKATAGEVSVPITDIRDEFARRRAAYAQVAVPDEAQIPEPAAPSGPRRLKAGEVRSIRQMAANGIGVDVIAAMFTVALGSVERILAGKTYRHVAV